MLELVHDVRLMDISHGVIPVGQNGAEPLREMKPRGFDERQGKNTELARG